MILNDNAVMCHKNSLLWNDWMCNEIFGRPAERLTGMSSNVPASFAAILRQGIYRKMAKCYSISKRRPATYASTTAYISKSACVKLRHSVVITT